MEKKWLVGQGAAAVDTLFHCATPVNLNGFTRSQQECVTAGGSGANLLAAAASVGVPAQLVAKIGDDSFGKLFRADMKENGIGEDYLVVQPGGTTLHTYIMVEPDGSRSIVVPGGDCHGTLQLEELPEEMLDDAFLFYTDGQPRALSAALVRRAAEKGVPVFYQRECMDPTQDPEYLRLGDEMMAHSALISGGPEIYEQLLGTAEPETAMPELYRRYRPRDGVVMTAGKQGAYWYDGETLLHQPIFPVTSVDSTGAGDSFCGGLIAAYYWYGWSREEALRFAAACGALKCTMSGPRLHVTKEQVLDFIRKYTEEGRV